MLNFQTFFLEEKENNTARANASAFSLDHIIFLNALEDYCVNFINVFTTQMNAFGFPSASLSRLFFHRLKKNLTLHLLMLSYR